MAFEGSERGDENERKSRGSVAYVCYGRLSKSLLLFQRAPALPLAATGRNQPPTTSSFNDQRVFTLLGICKLILDWKGHYIGWWHCKFGKECREVRDFFGNSFRCSGGGLMLMRLASAFVVVIICWPILTGACRAGILART